MSKKNSAPDWSATDMTAKWLRIHTGITDEVEYLLLFSSGTVIGLRFENVNNLLCANRASCSPHDSVAMQLRSHSDLRLPNTAHSFNVCESSHSLDPWRKLYGNTLLSHCPPIRHSATWPLFPFCGQSVVEPFSDVLCFSTPTQTLVHCYADVIM